MDRTSVPGTLIGVDMNSRVELSDDEKENFFGEMASSGPNPWQIDKVRDWDVFEDGFLRCGFRVEGGDILYFFTHVENDNPHYSRLQAMVDAGATRDEMRKVEPGSMGQKRPHPLPLQFNEVLKEAGREFFGEQFECTLVLEMEVWWARGIDGSRYVMKRNQLTHGFLEAVSQKTTHLLRDLS